MHGKMFTQNFADTAGGRYGRTDSVIPMNSLPSCQTAEQRRERDLTLLA